MKSLFLFGLVGLFAVGCNRLDDLNSDNHTIRETVENVKGSMIKKGEPVPAVDFSFILGRKSNRCKGFGVCEIVFLGLVIIDGPEKPVASIQQKENGDFIAEFLLTEMINAPVEDSTLYIDEDLTEDYDGFRYTIKSGLYNLDNSLGEFGGYVINVDRVEL